MKPSWAENLLASIYGMELERLTDLDLDREDSETIQKSLVRLLV